MSSPSSSTALTRRALAVTASKRGLAVSAGIKAGAELREGRHLAALCEHTSPSACNLLQGFDLSCKPDATGSGPAFTVGRTPL